MYLWHLSQLGVRSLLDVRGNPRAGRQEDMHRGKELTRALQGVGIRYEYWGDRFGEEALETQEEADLRRALKRMLAAASPGPLCLLGHMHEPHKCHRLALSSLVPPEWRVMHLMWSDHQSLCMLSHAEAQERFVADRDFFLARKEAEERSRLEDRARAARDDGGPRGRRHDGVASRGWRHGAAATAGSAAAAARHAEGDEAAEAATAAVAAAAAAELPLLVWADLAASEWEDRLRDGQAYRILLPWDTELLWYPRFLDDGDALKLEQSIADRVTMHHPTYLFQTPSGVTEEKINRKGQAKICDDFTFRVQYSSKRDRPQNYEVMAFEPWSRALLRRVEAASETVFNAIWFNHYRDGTVTIQWHADSDEGLGPNPVIGSVSLGSTRMFGFKSKRPLPQPPSRAKASGAAGIIHVNFPLFHGSLLVMGRNSQTHWLHAVPAMEGVGRERTNLTFRFYAHKDLVLTNAASERVPDLSSGLAGTNAEGEEEAQNCIQIRNSKLIREPEASQAPAADSREQGPSRLRLVPDVGAWCGLCEHVRPLLVDAPSSSATLVGDFVRRLGEAVMPDAARHLRLALPPLSAGAADAGGTARQAGQRRLLDDAEPLLEALVGRSGQIQELVYLPGDLAGAEPAAGQAAQARAGGGAAKKPPAAVPDCPDDLQRELWALPTGGYSPPRGGMDLVQAPEGADWLREVLSCLSGIQRKSKGRGGLSRFVFHQTSEFCALYAGAPKSAVHLLVTPTRLLSREELGAAEAALVLRMACYAEHLCSELGAAFPGLPLACGLRLRPGRARQLHGHLVGLDLAAPRPEDLERRHFEDFTSGPSHLLPLRVLARRLRAGAPAPAGPEAPPQEAAARQRAAWQRADWQRPPPLSCHRCGQLFADAFPQLRRHLVGCAAVWPEAAAAAAASGAPPPGRRQPVGEAHSDAVREVEELRQREVALLEEMGFGSCGRDTLMAALVAEGSVERAVAVLAVR